MSMWDVIIIAVVCLAIFRGYFKGLCRRLSDWVGLVIAFVASTLSVSHIDGFVSGTLGVDGRSKIGEWLESYFASRVSANPDNQLESLKQWVGNLFLPDTLKENLYGAIDDSASEIYVSIYNQVARVLADPIWHHRVLCALYPCRRDMWRTCTSLHGDAGHRPFSRCDRQWFSGDGRDRALYVDRRIHRTGIRRMVWARTASELHGTGAWSGHGRPA